MSLSLIILATPNAYASNAQVTISAGAANTKGTCSPTSCFNPQTLYINAGDTVTWTNTDSVGHTATSGNPSDNQTGTIFDSSLIASGKTYTSPAFSVPGTYNYFCAVHPWMTGQIVVSNNISQPTSQYNSPPQYNPPPQYTQPTQNPNTDITISYGASNTRGSCSTTSCFSPSVYSANVGQYVTWYNADTVGHTVTSGNPSDNRTGTIFDSSLIAAGRTYGFTFQYAGTYNYFCQVHPWMTGQVIVGGGSSQQIPSTNSIPVDGTSYSMAYAITNGNVIDVKANPQSESLIVTIQTTGNGMMTVSMPRELIDAKKSDGTDDRFVILNDGMQNAQAIETITTTNERILSIPFATGTQQIEIVGTFVVGAPITQTQYAPPPNTVIISNGAANTKGVCTTTSCFDPQSIHIGIGNTVTWMNYDTVGHTATSGRPSDTQTGTVFDSSLISAGKSYTSPAFNVQGTYNYFCQVHPWMTGQIIVGNGAPQMQSPPPYTINVQTDKSSYNLGDTVTVTAYSPGVPTGQNVAILVTDPLSNVVASRTIQFNGQGYATLQIGLSSNSPSGTYQVTASASSDGNYLKGSYSFTVASNIYTQSPSSGVSIVSAQSTNQLGNNVVASYGRGTTGFAKVVISSTSSQSALITVNLVGSDGTSLGVGSIKTSLGTGTSEMVVSFYIPSSASVGTANIYADIYSDWPTSGGTPLTAESSSTVGIQ